MAKKTWLVQYMDTKGKWRAQGRKPNREDARECARWLREKACYAKVRVLRLIGGKVAPYTRVSA